MISVHDWNIKSALRLQYPVTISKLSNVILDVRLIAVIAICQKLWDKCIRMKHLHFKTFSIFAINFVWLTWLKGDCFNCNEKWLFNIFSFVYKNILWVCVAFVPFNNRESHCEIERRRRNKMTAYMSELCDMIPTCSTLARKPDKLTILRMAGSYMKSLRGKPGPTSWWRPWLHASLCLPVYNL